MQSIDANCDSKMLITADDDAIRLWNANSGACLSTLIRDGPKRVRFAQDVICTCVISAGVVLVHLHDSTEPLHTDPFQTLILSGDNLGSKPPLPATDYRVTFVNDGTGDLGTVSVWTVWAGRNRHRRPPLHISRSLHSCGSQNVERIVVSSFRSPGAFEVVDFTGSHSDDADSGRTAQCEGMGLTCIIL